MQTEDRVINQNLKGENQQGKGNTTRFVQEIYNSGKKLKETVGQGRERQKQ